MAKDSKEPEQTKRLMKQLLKMSRKTLAPVLKGRSPHESKRTIPKGRMRTGKAGR
jgi:hypothetical protein